jgi:hypothetical protein
LCKGGDDQEGQSTDFKTFAEILSELPKLFEMGQDPRRSLVISLSEGWVKFPSSRTIEPKARREIGRVNRASGEAARFALKGAGVSASAIFQQAAEETGDLVEGGGVFVLR